MLPSRASPTNGRRRCAPLPTSIQSCWTSRRAITAATDVLGLPRCCTARRLCSAPGNSFLYLSGSGRPSRYLPVRVPWLIGSSGRAQVTCRCWPRRPGFPSAKLTRLARRYVVGRLANAATAPSHRPRAGVKMKSSPAWLLFGIAWANAIEPIERLAFCTGRNGPTAVGIGIGDVAGQAETRPGRSSTIWMPHGCKSTPHSNKHQRCPLQSPATMAVSSPFAIGSLRWALRRRWPTSAAARADSCAS